jgi:hypothetical protein
MRHCKLMEKVCGHPKNSRTTRRCRPSRPRSLSGKTANPWTEKSWCLDLPRPAKQATGLRLTHRKAQKMPTSPETPLIHDYTLATDLRLVSIWSGVVVG